MITWIIGNTKSGKTTFSESLQGFYKNHIKLDGDMMRGVWTDLGFSKQDRWKQNMRIARLAQVLDEQGFNVLVSVICPYAELRKEIKKVIDCKFVYIEGGKEGKQYPFDKPNLYEKVEKKHE